MCVCVFQGFSGPVGPVGMIGPVGTSVSVLRRYDMRVIAGLIMNVR